MSIVGGRTDTSGSQNAGVLAKMNEIASQYELTGSLADAELQDFLSLRQALNCASADQRLLVVVNGSAEQQAAAESKLKSLFSDKNVLGKFHLDFIDASKDAKWTTLLKGAEDTPSVMVVRTSQYGLDGQVSAQLSLDVDLEALKHSLLEQNDVFAKDEARKNYEEHVRDGRRSGFKFENKESRGGNN